MFDTYTLKARFYPVIILFFPIIIIGIFYSLHFETVIALCSSLGIAGALTYLFSQLGRDQGKLKEKSLWESWGGAPSTQVLRFADTTIDRHTKIRYHQKLLVLCPVDTTVNMDLESTDSVAADEVYRAWTKYLIAKTRDAKAFSLLYKDNTSYGFRRNVWGLKPQGLLLTLCLLITNYVFWVYKNHTLNPILFPDSFKYSTAVLLLVLLFWLFIVNKKWVKVPAFSYAERLCEAVENLPQQ